MPAIATPVAAPKRHINSNCAVTSHEFCALEGLTMDQYRKLQKDGNGPRERCLPGLVEPQILPADYAKWKKRIKQREVQNQIKRERKRRSEHMKRLAQRSLQSPKHISNRRRTAKQAAE